MKLQYSDPEAHERWCDEADYRRDEIRDNLWEEQQNKKDMNERLISDTEASDREMFTLLRTNDMEIQRLKAREEMRNQNNALMEYTYEFCKSEYQEAQVKLEETDYNSPDWHLNNYMEGYHKGRLRMIEHLKAAIQ